MASETETIETLRTMIRLAQEGRCVFCDWPLAESGCTKGRCSYLPAADSHEQRKIIERHIALGR